MPMQTNIHIKDEDAVKKENHDSSLLWCRQRLWSEDWDKTSSGAGGVPTIQLNFLVILFMMVPPFLYARSGRANAYSLYLGIRPWAYKRRYFCLYRVVERIIKEE